MDGFCRFLLVASCIIFQVSLQHEDHKKLQKTEEYDFIIVGSGPSGSVIANRLSEVQNWKILLLEAGDEPKLLSDVPSFAPKFQLSDSNWGFLTEKQEGAALGLIDGKMHWPRGKALGGSTIINYMIHVRGNKEDYDNWEALGNRGWSYKHLLPLFRKSEGSKLRHGDPGYHNTDGPVGVEDIPYSTKSTQAFIKAAQEVGYKSIDYNGESQLGVSLIQTTTKQGKRCSAEKSFLRNIKNRPNLIISTKSHVTKLLIDPTKNKAYGVKFIRKGKLYKVRATKEVILSAGVINSPQLLMLSGVGPKEHLEEFNIPVIQNLPVGKRIYDHLSYPGLVYTVNESIVFPQNEFKHPLTFLEYLYDGSGPLASLAGPEGLAFLKTNATNYIGNYPDIELIFVSASLQVDGGKIYKKMMRISDEIYDTLFKPLANSYAWSIWPLLLHPKSYGNLKLKSRNPLDSPTLYGGYFTDPKNEDIKTFIAAIREIQRIAAAPAFQKYDTREVRTALPGCKTQKYDSDEYWECALRQLATTLYHPTSTCKMGPSWDPDAVVDSRLKVYGIHNLRVADTSIFPTALSAHTTVPAYVVGEKASDLIKEDWNDKS